MFAMDIRVYNFLLAGWMKEGSFDFYMSTTIYDRILVKLEKNREATVPHHVTKYNRNTVDVQMEWALEHPMIFSVFTFAFLP